MSNALLLHRATLYIAIQVTFELGLCPDIYKSDRRLGDKTILCNEPAPLGSVTIGLYGNIVPATVDAFIRLVENGVYDITSANRIFQGEYIQFGLQGSSRLGQVEIPQDLSFSKSSDLLNSKAFQLRHIRPGTVSLLLGEDNVDDPVIKASCSRVTYSPILSTCIKFIRFDS